MDGYIKLWRSIKNEGHLKMPGAAFKLWFYCMLEAAPNPDRARGLDTGELWLDYDGIRQIIGETGRQMSKKTVSCALQYLEQNGYLERQNKPFHNLKVRVLKWGEVQSVSAAAAAAAAMPASPASLATTVAPATAVWPVAAAAPVICPFLAAGAAPPADPLAAAGAPTGTFSGTPVSTLAGTPTGTSTGTPTSTLAGTPTSTLTGLPASTLAGTGTPTDTSAGTFTGTPSGTITGTPASTEMVPDPLLEKNQELKIKELKIKDLKNKDLKNKEKRTKDFKEQVVVVDLLTYFEKEFGRPLSPLEVNQLTSWRSTLPEELIREALAQAVFRDKRSLAYTGGILRNWRQAGFRTVDEARRGKPGSSRPASSPDVRAAPAAWAVPAVRTAMPVRAAPATGMDQATAKKKAFIKSLYL